MWTITNDDLERLAIGAGILGTGGGGNPYIGKIHAKKLLSEGRTINVASLDEVPDDALVTSVGFMGSPVVSFERIRSGDEQVSALRALEHRIGKQFTHVIPSEVGGSNSVAPMTAAALTGLPVIDGDGMGRAFPELQMDTFMIYGVPAAPARSPTHAGMSPFSTALPTRTCLSGTRVPSQSAWAVRRDTPSRS